MQVLVPALGTESAGCKTTTPCRDLSASISQVAHLEHAPNNILIHQFVWQKMIQKCHFQM